MSGPDVWGPHGWKFIHYVTLGYPNNPSQEDKQKYFNFFNSLKNVIPCSICGNNFIEHLNINPLNDKVLSNKRKLIEWGIKMHNLTNLENKKKTFSLEEGFNEIIKNKDDCKKPISESLETFAHKKKVPKILLFILGLILLIYIIKK